MKWDEMTPRERDALVAEKVMGWRTPDFVEGEPIYPMLDSVKVPHYTTDISAAWRVLEKFEKHRLATRMNDWKKYEVCVGNKCFEYVGYAATAPEAICLAALRAVRVDV